MLNSAEMIFDAPMSERGRRYFSTLHKSSPDWVYKASEYTGRHRIIILYGAGHPQRSAYLQQHLSRGGRAVTFDLAYFDRHDSLRMSLDGLHPKPEHLAVSAALPTRRAFSLRDDGKESGHVVLAGLGRKSVSGLGLRVHEWENKALAEIRQRWPGVRVIWRPKKGDTLDFHSLPTITSETPVANVLRGARAVVCRHSNIAIDACIAGVPVYCEGGAALALYQNNPNPTANERLKFLHSLSWWEWSIHEAPQLWAWIEKLLKDTQHEN